LPAVWALLKEGCNPNFSSSTPAKYEGADPLKFSNAVEDRCDDLPPGLWWACHYRNLEMTKLLLEHGADPNYRRRGSTLLHKAMLGRSSLLEELALSPIPREIPMLIAELAPLISDIDSTDAHGETPLSIAIKLGDSATVSYLLERAGDDDLNFRDSSGCTYLHLASRPDIAKMLMDKGISSNKVNHKGQNTLHLAIEVQSLDMVCPMIDANTDMFQKDKGGNSAFDYGRQSDNPAIKKKVVETAAAKMDSKPSLEITRALCQLRGAYNLDSVDISRGTLFDRMIEPPYLATDSRIPLLLAHRCDMGKVTSDRLATTLENLREPREPYDIHTPEISFLKVLGTILEFGSARFYFQECASCSVDLWI
jgi:hypothetical protein